jgi:hypothetical protein
MRLLGRSILRIATFSAFLQMVSTVPLAPVAAAARNDVAAEQAA